MSHNKALFLDSIFLSPSLFPFPSSFPSITSFINSHHPLKSLLSIFLCIRHQARVLFSCCDVRNFHNHSGLNKSSGRSSIGQKSGHVMAGFFARGLTTLKTVSWQGQLPVWGCRRIHFQAHSDLGSICFPKAMWLRSCRLWVRDCFQPLEGASGSLPCGPRGQFTARLLLHLLDQHEWIFLTSSSATSWRKLSAFKGLWSKQGYFPFAT